MANEFSLWFNSIPFCTRYWFAGSIILPLLGRFGLVNAYSMFLHGPSIIPGLQIWRPITALFFFPLTPGSGFTYLMNLYFLYNYSKRLEEGYYAASPADYLFLLLFNWLTLIVIGLAAGLPLLMIPMVVSVLYIWCQLNKDVIVSFWFGTQFKALYLPWVLAALNMILHGGGVQEIIGIIVGHIFFFFKFQYPQEYGGALLFDTPQFLKRMLPGSRPFGGFGVPPASRAAPRTASSGHNWGAGNRLGE